MFRDVAKGMRIDWKQALANYGMRNHYFGYQYKPVASLEDFDKKQLRDLYIREVIFNIGDKVHYVTEDVYGKIVRRSTNYIVSLKMKMITYIRHGYMIVYLNQQIKRLQSESLI